MNETAVSVRVGRTVEPELDLGAAEGSHGDDDRGPCRDPGPPATTDLVVLIEFRWQVSTGVQPVLFAERVLLH